LQLGLLLVAPKYYDRYLLPLVAGALAVAAAVSGPPRWPAGLAALALLGGLSVCLMHDWLSRNAARWELGHRAAAYGIAPTNIQGGMEWDHTYYSKRSATKDYRLSLSASGASAVVDTEPYTLWLPPRRAQMYLLRLESPSGGGKAR
jgi:hypothetical protein